MSNPKHSAFPTPAVPFSDGSFDPSVPGLTKREYFAAMAMQGILSNGTILQQHGLQTEATAKNAIEFADALLAELAKRSVG